MDDIQYLEAWDGTKHLVTEFGDLVGLVRDYIGDEFADYAIYWQKAAEEAMEELEEDRDEYKRSLESEQDDQRRLLCDIWEEAEAMEDLLSASRLDRKKLLEACRGIWKMCNEVL